MIQNLTTYFPTKEDLVEISPLLVQVDNVTAVEQKSCIGNSVFYANTAFASTYFPARISAAIFSASTSLLLVSSCSLIILFSKSSRIFRKDDSDEYDRLHETVKKKQ